jgi:hypothetical protein
MITIPHTPNLIIFNSSCCAATHEGGENSKGEDLHVSRKNLARPTLAHKDGQLPQHSMSNFFTVAGGISGALAVGLGELNNRLFTQPHRALHRQVPMELTA